jgi:hypothetical protein
MAISDVLFEAANDIRGYLERQPQVYSDYTPRLQELLQTMDAIRRELDNPAVPSITRSTALSGGASRDVVNGPM